MEVIWVYILHAIRETVLIITKALTKTTNCTFKAKKVEGHDQKNSDA